MIDTALTERSPESRRLSNLPWPDNDLEMGLFFGQPVLNNSDKKTVFPHNAGSLARLRQFIKSLLQIVSTKTELKTEIAEVKTEIAELEAGLHRHLWVMAAGIVGLTVSLTVALVRLTS